MKGVGEMIRGEDELFDPGIFQPREMARGVIGQLMATKDAEYEPTEDAAEGEGGIPRDPPQRDKEKKFNLGPSLQEAEQLQMLRMLEENEDRFAYCLEDIEPFKGEPMEIPLNSDRAIFRPPHKLGQVEWDFVGAQCEKLAALGFIQRST